MANTKTLKTSFNGGEVTSELYGQIADAKYQAGVATMRNFVATPQGPAENRAGTLYVREVKDSTKRTRLIPFTFSTTQTMAIEVGAGYFRFHTQGATLESSPGVPYEITNPYAEEDLFDLHYVQSSDVLTIVHPNYAPRELRRLGALSWTLTTISFTSSVAAPAAPTVTTAGLTTAKYTYYYVVTSIGPDGVTESEASPPGSVASNLFETGCTINISWPPIVGATRFRVYKLQGGLYGYIGQTTSNSIVDDNIAPDLSITPPIYDSVFGSSGNYPAAVSYYEQRRCFAGTTNEPQTIWETKSGTESNMSYSIPIRDDDRIKFRIAAREANTIRHIVPLSQLLLMTSSAEWRVTSVNSDAITPTSISVKPQSYVGASNVQPQIVNNTLVFAGSRGGHVYELAYNWQASGFMTGDVSLRSTHLFDNKNIVDMAYSKAPRPLIWFVRDDGTLLGLTYIPEQQVGAWHRHDTDGAFESCCAVAEGNEDALYVIVRRTINGVSKRYVERLQSRQFAALKDAWFVDCGLSYSGAATATISGLGHLEGKTVSILIDGAVHPQRVVTGGAISLDIPLPPDVPNYSIKAIIGLPITGDLETLPMAQQIDNAFGQGRAKNVNKAWLRVFKSSGIFVGPDEDHLREVKQRTSEPMGQPPSLKNEEVELVITPSWGQDGRVFVRQVDPLPLTVCNLTLEVALGG